MLFIIFFSFSFFIFIIILSLHPHPSNNVADIVEWKASTINYSECNAGLRRIRFHSFELPTLQRTSSFITRNDNTPKAVAGERYGPPKASHKARRNATTPVRAI